MAKIRRAKALSKLSNGIKMIDRILLKFFGGIDKVTEWLFAWQAPRCKCKNKRKRHG